MAETRDTQVLEDVVESTEIENPRTTEEAILAKIIAGEEVDINARTRYQVYLKELSSIGGGNPNYIETCPVGTVGNPWGEKSIAELHAAASRDDISIYLHANTSSVIGIDITTLLYFVDDADNTFIANGVGSAGNDVSDWLCFRLTYWNDNSAVRVLMYGSVISDVDAESFLALPANIIIFHHPLPEEDNS